MKMIHDPARFPAMTLPLSHAPSFRRTVLPQGLTTKYESAPLPFALRYRRANAGATGLRYLSPNGDVTFIQKPKSRFFKLSLTPAPLPESDPGHTEMTGSRSLLGTFLPKTWWIIALMWLAVLSGCAVGPTYQRPEVTSIPEAYTGPSGEWKIAVPQAHLPRGNWWEIFGDLELDQLEADAAAANQDLKAAAARFEQARAVADVARSGLFPRLGGSFFPLRQRDSENRPAGGKPGDTYDSFTVPFDLSYEIDLWGRVRRAVESATAQKEASADDVESVRLAIQAEVAADYFSVRALDADKALLLSSIEVYRKSLGLVRNRRAGGMVSDLDVAQAETVLKTTEAQLPDNALQRAKFEHALAVLTGKNASLFRVEERPLDLAPLIVPPDLPSDLLERRPDIASAERRMAAANANIGVATAAFFPTIKFTV